MMLFGLIFMELLMTDDEIDMRRVFIFTPSVEISTARLNLINIL